MPSEYTAAFLYAQLQNLNEIQQKRINLWNYYYEGLKDIAKIELPFIPDYATNNAHMFYIVCQSLSVRTELIHYLKEHGIQAVFHYLSLHKSEFNTKRATEIADLPMADTYADCLLRLPLFVDLEKDDVCKIVEIIHDFFQN